MLASKITAATCQALAKTFAFPVWQLATIATDANRFVWCWARSVTGRKKVLVFDGCYHGTVDDTMIDLVDG